MTEEEKNTVQNFIKDFWKFFRKYLEPQDSDEFWDEVIDTAGELMQKYDYTPIFTQVIIGYIDGLEEKWRKATGR